MEKNINYDLYLDEHKKNVYIAFCWLKDNLPENLFNTKLKEDAQFECRFKHDFSKYSEEEYIGYSNFYYGNEDNVSKTIKDYEYSNLHHLHNNPHHWQYWVLISSNIPYQKALEIPDIYIIEMICDWWSFSWWDKNLLEIFDWYDKHKSHMIINEKSLNKINSILLFIKNKLNNKKEIEKAYKTYSKKCNFYRQLSLFEKEKPI